VHNHLSHRPHDPAIGLRLAQFTIGCCCPSRPPNERTSERRPPTPRPSIRTSNLAMPPAAPPSLLEPCHTGEGKKRLGAQRPSGPADATHPPSNLPHHLFRKPPAGGPKSAPHRRTPLGTVNPNGANRGPHPRPDSSHPVSPGMIPSRHRLPLATVARIGPSRTPLGVNGPPSATATDSSITADGSPHPHALAPSRTAWPTSAPLPALPPDWEIASSQWRAFHFDTLPVIASLPSRHRPTVVAHAYPPHAGSAPAQLLADKPWPLLERTPAWLPPSLRMITWPPPPPASRPRPTHVQPTHPGRSRLPTEHDLPFQSSAADCWAASAE